MMWDVFLLDLIYVFETFVILRVDFLNESS